jgi:hypothetical protein
VARQENPMVRSLTRRCLMKSGIDSRGEAF